MRAAPLGLSLAAALLAAPAFAVDQGVDRGIWPDLDASVPLGPPLPAGARAASPPRLLIDAAHGLATVFAGEDPVALYPYPLDANARAAIAAYAPRHDEVHAAPGRDQDRDRDGIVDRLDVLRGAKKLLVNRAAYHARYRRLAYPNGDVPRDEGVCTDTIVRALRNAGIDLQREVHEDLLAARRAYAVVDKIDASINHRRVKTLLVWFRRHTRALPPGEDEQPGDFVFFDTFPSRPGAEHVGVLSDRRAPDGRLLVINNWTDGAVDAEMPLLGAVAVTDHFRVAPPERPRPAATR